MSVSELLERLKALPVGAPLDWRQIREDIHTEHERATTTADRVALLKIHKALMDRVERDVASDNMEKFKEARRKDYRILIARETLVGENVDPQKLGEITQREVEAGRMASDDNLRELGLIGARFLTPLPRKGDIMRKVFLGSVVCVVAIIAIYAVTLVLGPAHVR